MSSSDAGYEIAPPVSEIRYVDAGPYRALLVDAARLVVIAQYAHSAQLKCQLRVGSVQASRLLGLLEDAGVITGRGTDGKRTVLVSIERLDEALAVLGACTSEVC